MSNSSNHESAYKPMMSEERARRIRDWQNAIFESQESAEDISMNYLGVELRVPHQVHSPAPMSELLGQAVLGEVRETDRVLDMGTGSGINAILAASKSSDVIAVDSNPFAVESATENAALNGASASIEVLQSDLFEKVKGTFDLIIFDPPFRWFSPRDIRESATTDENYKTLTAFFQRVGQYLNDDGRVLIFFGTSGDSDYLHKLIRDANFRIEKLSRWELVKDGLEVEYYAYKLTREA